MTVSERVLTDPKANEVLARQGYVVMPLCGASELDRLHVTHGLLRPSPGVGFDADLANNDIRYRTAVKLAAEDALGGLIRGLFSGFEPFLWNFLCKWPGDEEDLYMHHDWMFVDEGLGARSYSAWVPLRDVDRSVGVLQIVPGSHQLAGGLAGTNLDPPWMKHVDELRGALLDVPVAAGSCVVMDHRVVHASTRNLSGTKRVALGCAVRRRDDQLVHYRRGLEGEPMKFDVDERFFLECTPQRLASETPGRWTHHECVVDDREVSAAEVRSILTTSRERRLWRRLPAAFRR